MQLHRIILMITISGTLKWVSLQSSEMLKVQFSTEKWINGSIGFPLYVLLCVSVICKTILLSLQDDFSALIARLSNMAP